MRSENPTKFHDKYNNKDTTWSITKPPAQKNYEIKAIEPIPELNV